MIDDRACGLRAVLRMEADPRAPSHARRLVRDVLVENGRSAWVDAAELAVSELVTNAVLHARTPIDLSVVLGAAELRVEVRDFSPVTPQQRHYGALATTGRGMALVGSLTSSCGVTRLHDGKSAWFTLSDDAAEPSIEDLLAAFDDEQWDIVAAAATHPSLADVPVPTQQVVLSGVPPTLWLAAREHHDALLRELGLYCAAHPEVEVDFTGVERARRALSNPVMTRIRDADRTSTSPTGAGPGHERPGPLPEALPAIDVVLELLPDAAPAAAALQDALDTGERLAGAGALLAFPGQPEVVAIRDWLCEQVQSQLGGVPPRPWSGVADRRFEHGTAHAPTSSQAQAVIRQVQASTRGVVASDARNRILAVSGPLATALGWRPEDLVGRRIVVLVPPHLREAHIAGFSRHQTTGQAHVLGVPLELPVQHASGAEVLCAFMVEQVSAGSGWPLYLAWIEPVEGYQAET